MLRKSMGPARAEHKILSGTDWYMQQTFRAVNQVNYVSSGYCLLALVFWSLRPCACVRVHGALLCVDGLESAWYAFVCGWL